MVSSPISSALTTRSNTIDIELAAMFVLFRQYVSEPIGVVNFNGTTFSAVIGKCKVNVTTGGTQIKLALGVRLYKTGGTFATLASVGAVDTNFTTTGATRIVSAAALANVTSQNNDRLVVEFGIFTASLPGTRAVDERFGDNAGSDFALTTALTTDLNPWCEFSATIPAPAAGGVNSGFFGLMG